MEYVAICIAILLWLIRPQDWVSGLSGFGFMTYVMLASLYGVARRPGGFQIKLLFRSPADWLVAAYLIWIIWTTGDYFSTAKALIPSASFYFCTALALTSIPRLYRFLSCWVAGLAVVVIFALSTHYGMELAPGSDDLTESFGGRLALNTWMFNNPNSLGHGVAAFLPAAYLWLVWRRPLAIRTIGLLLIGGAAQCLYLTESKGAYLCGAAAITMSLLFGKSRVFQIVTLLLILTVGLGAIKMLPRMETLDSKEAGIAGRLIIWQMAHTTMRNTFSGVGWSKFEAWIQTKDYGLIKKATHGSYVNIGADLGYPGLFLFVAILYANGKTLWQTRRDVDDEPDERCQRTLLSLTASFAASAFMIDKAYHTDYFILAGAVAAYHRIVTRGSSATEDSRFHSNDLDEGQPDPTPDGKLMLPTSFSSTGAGMNDSGTIVFVTSPRREPSDRLYSGSQHLEPSIASSGTLVRLSWCRLRPLDFLLIGACFWAVLSTWERMMTDFINL